MSLLRRNGLSGRPRLARALLAIALTGALAAAGADAAGSPADGVFQIPGLFVTAGKKTMLSQEQGHFTSRCYRPSDPITSQVTVGPPHGKPARYSVNGRLETSDGVTISWTGSYTAGAAGQYSGTGTGTWQAAGLPTGCQHAGSPSAQGSLAIAWVPTADGVTERFTFTAFSP